MHIEKKRQRGGHRHRNRRRQVEGVQAAGGVWSPGEGQALEQAERGQKGALPCPPPASGLLPSRSPHGPSASVVYLGTAGWSLIHLTAPARGLGWAGAGWGGAGCGVVAQSWEHPQEGWEQGLLGLYLPERRAPDFRKAVIQPFNKQNQVAPSLGRAEPSMWPALPRTTVQSGLRGTREPACRIVCGELLVSTINHSKMPVNQMQSWLLFFHQVVTFGLPLPEPTVQPLLSSPP